MPTGASLVGTGLNGLHLGDAVFVIGDVFAFEAHARFVTVVFTAIRGVRSSLFFVEAFAPRGAVPVVAVGRITEVRRGRRRGVSGARTQVARNWCEVSLLAFHTTVRGVLNDGPGLCAWTTWNAALAVVCGDHAVHLHEDIPAHALDCLRVGLSSVSVVGPLPLRMFSMVQVWCRVNPVEKILTRTAGGTLEHPVIVVPRAVSVAICTQIDSRLVHGQSRRCLGSGGAPRVGSVTAVTGSGTTQEVHLAGLMVHRLDALTVHLIAVLSDGAVSRAVAVCAATRPTSFLTVSLPVTLPFRAACHATRKFDSLHRSVEDEHLITRARELKLAMGNILFFHARFEHVRSNDRSSCESATGSDEFTETFIRAPSVVRNLTESFAAVELFRGGCRCVGIKPTLPFIFPISKCPNTGVSRVQDVALLECARQHDAEVIGVVSLDGNDGAVTCAQNALGSARGGDGT